MARSSPVKPGDQFARLTVVEHAGVTGGKTYYTCRCICRKVVPVRGTHLTGGVVKSCGCLRAEVTGSLAYSKPPPECKFKVYKRTHRLYHPQTTGSWYSAIDADFDNWGD